MQLNPQHVSRYCQEIEDSTQENPQYRLWGFILVTVFTLMLAGVVSPYAIVIICAMAFFHVIEF